MTAGGDGSSKFEVSSRRGLLGLREGAVAVALRIGLRESGRQMQGADEVDAMDELEVVGCCCWRSLALPPLVHAAALCQSPALMIKRSGTHVLSKVARFGPKIAGSRWCALIHPVVNPVDGTCRCMGVAEISNPSGVVCILTKHHG